METESGKPKAVADSVEAQRNELLPCPFCGDENVTVQEYDTKDVWWTVCDNIYCGTEGPTRKTRDAAVAAWNKRTAVSNASSFSQTESEKALEEKEAGGRNTLGIQMALEEVVEFAEWGWTIIANAGGGDWENESADWQEAAAKYRDRFHNEIKKYLSENGPKSSDGSGFSQNLPRVGDRDIEKARGEDSLETGGQP